MLPFVFEFIGTFFFLYIILATGQALPIGIALAAAIFFAGSVSGAHLNPAVSTMLLAKGSLSLEKWMGYVVVQVLGGLVALTLFNATTTKSKRI